MKVCFVVELYHPRTGGQYTSLRDIVAQLNRRKINNIIIHKNSKIYNNKKLLYEVIRNSDVIHFFGGWNIFYIKLNLLALRLKKKIIIHPLGFYEPWSLNQKKIKKIFAWNLYQKQLLLRANLIHCASNEEKKSLLNLHKKFKTIVLPFGIEDSFVKKKIKKKLNKRALFFSRLHEKKGLSDLIDIWQDINNEDWSLDIVGDGENKKYYKNMIVSKINSKIKFLKPIYNNYEKTKLFNKYDLFILPTKNENFGISILESLSRGLPVLTTKNTPWHSIKKYNAGWIIKKTYPELKLTLIKIFKMRNDEFFIKSKNAIRLASKFKWSKIFTEYIKVYKNLLAS